MKNLSLVEMENISGGGFINGFCIGMGIGTGAIGIVAVVAGSVTGGIGAAVCGALSIGCGIYSAVY